jgi:fructokinase
VVISVVGEALVDLVAEHGGSQFAAHPGGSPANVAVSLGRLGVPVTLATQLGDDPLGRLVADHVRASGAGLDVLPARSETTSLALAMLDDNNAASYDFRINWDITDAPDLNSDVRCVHAGSLGLALRPGADVVEEYVRKARGMALISYDPNIRPSLERPRAKAVDRVERHVGVSDVVKASLDDVRWLYPDIDHKAVASTWVSLGPSLVVITLGEAGAYAVTAADAVTCPAPEVDVADTVGAGDAFTAGLLAALLDAGLLGVEAREVVAELAGRPLTEVVEFACAVAAITSSRAGADPPTRADIGQM